MFQRRLPYSISIAAMLAFVGGLLLSCTLFLGIARLESDKTALNFQQLAEARFTAVSKGLDDAVRVLAVLNQLFSTVDTVSREQFHSFTQPLLARYPYIRAFNFHRLLSQAERPAYEAGIRQQMPGFVVNEMKNGKVLPAGVKSSYNIVDFIEPMQGNEAAFGLDVSPNAMMNRSMQLALDSGQPAATGLLQLAQGSDRQPGFVVLIPVYRPGAVPENAKARHNAVIGDTAAVFRAGDLFEKTLSAAGLLNAAGINLSVYAGSRPDAANLAFRRGSAPPAATAAPLLPAWLLNEPPDSVAYTFEVAGQPWHMVVSASPLPFARNHLDALLILLGGSLFSLLAAAYLQTLALRSQRIRQQVEERTADLKLANQHLLEDIAARKRVELALQASEERFHRLADLSSDWYWEQDEQFRFTIITGDLSGKGGIAAEHYVGKARWEMPIEMSEAEWAAHRATLEAHQAFTNLEYRSINDLPHVYWFSINGEPLFDADGKFKGYRGTGKDITERKQAEARIQHMAHHDVLTGLPNRALLQDRLSQAIAYAERYAQPIWVVFIDLDRFKFVNDSLGHKAGDQLLNAMAQRLQSATRETDTVARLGGDEFVLVLPARSDEAMAGGILQRIMDSIAQPLAIAEQTFYLGCSMGVAIYPADGSSAEELIEHADIAMYRAKETGRNNFQFYTAAMNAGMLERLRLESALRSALERDEFVLHYQPQVDLQSGRVVGMEALIRWQHPQLGMVSPLRFISLAEETGLIVPIGAWVLRTACAQNQAWQQAGLGPLRIAVNLSARQFAQPGLAQSIGAALAESGLAPQYLDLELTESLVMTDVERTIEVLRELKALGLQLSIDDFGTGYSSLSYLKRFPIDVLKIDQSFVRDITHHPDDALIVMSIIALAHNLKLHVIAEGVETQEQLDYLQQHGCDEMQGYFFSRPVPAAEFEQLLRQGKQLPGVAATLIA